MKIGVCFMDDRMMPRPDYITALLGFISCIAVCLGVYFALCSKQEQEECKRLGGVRTKTDLCR